MQTQVKLIGYPLAGVASSFPQGCSPLSTYGLIASGLRVGRGEQGDITGKFNRGKGKGKGKGHGSATLFEWVTDRKGRARRKIISRRRGVKGKARGSKLAVGGRAVGVGIDPDTARDMALEDWLSPSIEVNFEQVPDMPRAGARAAIVAAIAAESDLPSRLLAFGQRAAAKQSRRIFDLRGVRPSQTSIEDAAADAVCGILTHVRRLDKVTLAQWQSPKLLKLLGMYAGRAAFRSLASWSVSGMTGDNTHGKRDRRQFVQSLTEDLANEACLMASSDGAGNLSDGLTIRRKDDLPIYDASQQFSRRAFVRWVYQVGLREFKASLPNSKGSGRAVNAARSRCRVVANVILGQSLADSCALSGFRTVQNFVESCKGAGFFESLRDARRVAILDCQAVEAARVAQARFASQAAAIIRRLRYLDAGQWDSERLGTGAGCSGSPGGLVLVRRLMDARAYCVTMAKYYKRIANHAAADNLALFDRVLSGLYSDKYGDLRRLFGLTDKQGRNRGSSKVNPAMIAKPSGKVPRKRSFATIGLPVGKGKRTSPHASGLAPCSPRSQSSR